MTHWEPLNREVLFDKNSRRIIWQPRIGCWYDDKLFYHQPFPEGFSGLSKPEIFRKLNCSDRLYDYYNDCFVRVEDPRVEFVRELLNETDVRTVIRTPAGEQVIIERTTPTCPYPLILKHEVESEQELKVAIWREEHTTYRWDQEHYEKNRAEVGDLGAPTIFMPRMSIQSLYLDKMGVENGIYALYDFTDTAEAYFRARETSQLQLIAIINESPIDIINFGENVHSGTLPPDLFEKYHLPYCQRRSEALHAGGKFVYSHWDGDCKVLLPYMQETGLDGIEAITPHPQGDVSLEEIREHIGDMYLLDGIPAVLFDEQFDEQQLIDTTHKLIEYFAPHLVLGISDELSSTGSIERVALVGELVDAYNESVCTHTDDLSEGVTL